MTTEQDRYMELEGLEDCISDFRGDIEDYMDSDCLLGQDKTVVESILKNLEDATNRLNSIMNKEVKTCPCGHMPRFNPYEMKVECRKCGMSGPKKAIRAEAVDAWNKIVEKVME